MKKMYRTNRSLLLFFSCLYFVFFAQPLQAQIGKAKKLVLKEHYRKAVPILEQILGAEPNNPQALYLSAICNLHNYSNELALAQILKAQKVEKAKFDIHFSYWMGNAYHGNLMFDSAIVYYNDYKEKIGRKSQRQLDLDKLIEECKQGKTHAALGRPKFYVEGLDRLVNSYHSEHSPVLSSDGKYLVLTSRVDHSENRKEAPDGNFFEDIYICERGEDGLWSKPVHIKELNSKGHDASIQFFDNDQQMLIYRFKNGGDIYVSKKEGDKWSDPQPIDKKNINSKGFEAHATISADGKLLVLASDRNKHSHLDLFYSILGEDGKWSKVERLPDHINTPFDENAPFLAFDNKTLYFSSKGHNSMGKYDIFEVTYQFDGQKVSWGQVKHLGMPLNSPDNDIYLNMTADGSLGYFASNRDGSQGEKDIYKFGIAYDIQIEGIVLEYSEGQPLADFQVAFLDKDYQQTYTAKTDQDGKYTLSLPSEMKGPITVFSPDRQQRQIMEGDKELKLPIIKVEGTSKTIDLKVLVPELESKEITVSGVVEDFYDYKSANIEPVVVIRDAKTGQVIGETKVVDDKYTLTVKLKPNQEYTFDYKRADNSFDKVSSLKVTPETKPGTALSKNIKIVQPDAPLVSNELKQIYFDFGKTTLKDGSQSTLENIVAMLKENPSLLIEIEGHTDNVGSEKVNLNVSKKRVKAVSHKVNAMGIPKSRIKEIYSGMSKPIADNETEEGREMNRRVEIRLIDPEKLD